MTLRRLGVQAITVAESHPEGGQVHRMCHQADRAGHLHPGGNRQDRDRNNDRVSRRVGLEIRQAGVAGMRGGKEPKNVIRTPPQFDEQPRTRLRTRCDGRNLHALTRARYSEMFAHYTVMR